MKRIKLLPLLTALLSATTTWATDYNVNQNHLLYLPAKRRTYIW